MKVFKIDYEKVCKGYITISLWILISEQLSYEIDILIKLFSANYEHFIHNIVTWVTCCNHIISQKILKNCFSFTYEFGNFYNKFNKNFLNL